MAVRYAVATGNWSNTAIWNGGTLPTSADDVYSNNFTVTINQDVTVLSLQNVAQSPAVAGGSFSLISGFTVTCTAINGIIAGNAICVTYTGTGTSIINANIINATTGNINTLVHSGLGILTINGNITHTSNIANYILLLSNTGVLNINGNLNSFNSGLVNCNIVNVSAAATLNIIGSLDARGTLKTCVNLTSNSTLNLTGNMTIQSAGGNSVTGISAVNATVNITGNLIITNSQSATSSSQYCLNAINNCNINIIGMISGDVTPLASPSNNPVIITGTAGYFKHIGPCISGTNHTAIVCTVLTAINILTGPFISSNNGIQPFNILRIHYQKTIGSYFEFRDSTTNGAILPAPVAPATRLVSPDTVVDAPIPSNVRNGISYALGTSTGTLRVPTPASVAKDVPTDNTVGTAILSAADIFNTLVSTMNVSGSIGERLKNVSTVQTNGEQLASLN